MCGLTGFLSKSGYHCENEKILTVMAEAIDYRGPDDFGAWVDATNNIGLAHRRLSVIDLSSAGHQPMSSPAKRYKVVFNGEIYNHAELRNELDLSGKAPKWRGHSDTETLVSCFDVWGVESTLKKTRGMFAIAVWDLKEKQLTLARDRVGEKPLYYGWHNGVLLFGSELKSLIAHPAFVKDIDRNVLALYMRHFYVPSPHCIWQNTHKVLPGYALVFSADGALLDEYAHWDSKQVIESAKRNPYRGTVVDATNDVDQVLNLSVQEQMLADVPLGGFLSGGVDSSMIVALMQAQSVRPVETFSIGFHEESHNEAVFAKAVAKHLGTSHTELYVKADDALDLIPNIAKVYDEPFADASQLPTFVVNQLARKKVTVALSGDGGDELFCGYSRYTQAKSIWNKIGGIPHPIRSLAANVLGNMPIYWVNHLTKSRGINVADKLLKSRKLLTAKNQQEMYHRLVSLWENPEELVLGGVEPDYIFTNNSRMPVADNFLESMMAMDMLSYLPDDILVKVDRASMANSLEARVPFLDRRVIELAWRLPIDFKLRNGESKYVLKQVLFNYVPRELIERPKKGFSVPMNQWLKGPLKELCMDLLDPARIESQGLLDSGMTSVLLKEHFSGRRNWADRLWAILVFQMWYEEYFTV